MTTAWAHAVRGNVTEAAAANLGGTLLLGLAMLAAAWALAAAAWGRWLFARPDLRWTLGIGTVWLIVVLLDWARRLAGG
jgi:hypothetical protein